MSVSWEYAISGEVDKRRNARNTLLLTESTSFPVLDLPGEVVHSVISDFVTRPGEMSFDFVLVAFTEPLRAVDELLLQIHLPDVLNKGAIVMQVTLSGGPALLHLPLIHLKYTVPFDSADYQVLIQGKE